MRREPYLEQHADLPGNREQQQQPRRQVRGYAPPIVLPDVQPSDRLTEEDEALAGYPDVAPGRLRSSVSQRWMQAVSSQEMVPYQDVDMLNVIVTPRRTHRSGQQQRPLGRAPRRDQQREEELLTTDVSRPAFLQPPARRRSFLHRVHLSPPLFLLLGMLVMFVLDVLVTTLVQVWQGWQNDWHYGYPRTSQTDAVVGHNHDSAAHPSHFLAENLRGEIVVIEFPAGDTVHALAYDGPTLSGQDGDATPVTLTFKDVTGDGAPDMIIHTGTITAVFVNDPAHNDFRPLRPGDHVVSGSLS